MDKESYFIQNIANNSFIGDDGAFIEKYIYSCDAFFEDVHFKKEWFSLKQIAKKAMLVNISDALAMGACPKYALISISIPKYFSLSDINDLADTFKCVSQEFGIDIIGGDTICASKLNISITLISKPNGNIIYRKGLDIGDFLCYTGHLGQVNKDLKILKRGGNINKNSKFIAPILHTDFMYEAKKYMSSCMDISDGLSYELSRLSRINKVGFKFLKHMPKDVLCSGEEYELLFSMKPKHILSIKRLSKKYRVKVNIFAFAIRGIYKNICSPHHF